MTHLKHMALPSRALLVLLLGLLVGLSVVLAGVSTHAHAHPASIITVSNCSTESALSTAIGSAMPGDTINFSCSGTIPITTTLTISTNLTLDGDGQSVTLDGGGTTEVLSVASGVQFTLNHLTIAHGNSFSGGGLGNEGTATITNSTFDHNVASSGNGGGINNKGTVTITNSTFDHNVAAFAGGGLENFPSSTVSVTNSTFSNNSASNGGGLGNDATATITNSTFDHNSATIGGGLENFSSSTVTITNSTFSNNSVLADGGGLDNGGTATITNSTFDHNSAPVFGGFGGGLKNDVGGTVSVTNSTFSNNSASNGGGLFNAGTVTITNSTFSNNSASNFGNGGGINNNGTATITNSTFDHNSSPNFGGGLFNDITVTITFSTFANNSAVFTGGGLFNHGGTLKVKASIVANNTGGNCAGSLTDQGYNLESATDCGFTAGTDHQSSNPLLGPLANNGGPTQTLALLVGSPAIDQVPFSVCVATDQRGVARIDHQEPCDIGAFEFPDPTAPVLHFPSPPISVDATSPAGAVVTYTVTATDDEAIASVTCTPPSGGTFPIGDTTVNCTATDVDGVSATGSFVIHVKGAAEQISDLISLVNSFNLSPRGIQTSFDSQLQAVQTDLAANNTAQACSDLTSFISHVKAQSGKKLTVSQANQLLAAATQIKAVLGC